MKTCLSLVVSGFVQSVAKLSIDKYIGQNVEYHNTTVRLLAIDPDGSKVLIYIPPTPTSHGTIYDEDMLVSINEVRPFEYGITFRIELDSF